jgi:hypothetical protein
MVYHNEVNSPPFFAGGSNLLVLIVRGIDVIFSQHVRFTDLGYRAPPAIHQ